MKNARTIGFGSGPAGDMPPVWPPTLKADTADLAHYIAGYGAKRLDLMPAFPKLSAPNWPPPARASISSQ